MVLLLALSGMAVASEPQDSEDGAGRKERAARLDVMRRRALALTVEVETDDRRTTAAIVEAPILRYSNPAAAVIMPDATVWAWGRRGRPVVLASIEEAGCEIVSLAEEAVSAVTKSGRKWSADASEIAWHAVPDAPPPAETAGQRARQMKDISQQFSAQGHYGKGAENYELRLLDRPLHRYSNPEQRLVDGAIFAFVAGTNPEVILLVECRPSEEKRLTWFYGFTRLSAGALEARRGKTIVWSCPAISRWSERAPYSTVAFGKEDIVPESDLPPAEDR